MICLFFFVGGIYVFKQMGIQAIGQSKDCPFCIYKQKK